MLSFHHYFKFVRAVRGSVDLKHAERFFPAEVMISLLAFYIII